jgi:hypothetical protein
MDELKVNNFPSMNFSHRIQYLEMICTTDANIEIVIQIILKNYSVYIPHLRFLCIALRDLNDQTVEQFQRMIDREKLLDNCTIQYRNNKLYLR